MWTYVNMKIAVIDFFVPVKMVPWDTGVDPPRWGEPVCDFTACLRQHAKDRNLDRTARYYWVCAYANNQWNVSGEIGARSNRSKRRARRAVKGCWSARSNGTRKILQHIAANLWIYWIWIYPSAYLSYIYHIYHTYLQWSKAPVDLGFSTQEKIPPTAASAVPCAKPLELSLSWTKMPFATRSLSPSV